ncbi:DNA cytosine methyltransferase [Pseudokineococcus lusitanus]|uniref:Cytosine-specific methyltransferase n=1 Tax=Pseudokineococcus lusitanus TaxID=763993 RepID=A0A3N1GWH0_9ACTN|nr:DNA cytosine methyltransferase [Pseudokineococcus lusitanus]ROP34603.1 DNA (cytosine-5)-methyltransferase 1 [Pseudokineococcus lusitanus]
MSTVVNVLGDHVVPVGSDADGGALTVVDLFCGAGGLSEGFRRAGYQVTAGSDHDPDAIATYAANFPDAVALCGDVRDAELREQLDEAAAGADVLVGGPPCQAFSQVRNHTRLIDDPRNSLYREFVSAVGAALPDAFMMENVPGMAQMGVKEQVMTDLSLDGEYTVVPQLVDAADFGVPQTRKRLLFLGVRTALSAEPPTLVGTGATGAVQLVRFADHSAAVGGTTVSADAPIPGYVPTARPDARGERVALALADPFDPSVVSVEQALGDLTALQTGRRAETLSTSELPDPTSAYQRMMRDGHRDELGNVSVPRMQADTALRLAGIPAGGNHRDLSEQLQARYLTGAKWGPSNGSGRLGRAHYYAYRRLHPEMWAWTLNTKGDSAYHWSSARCLSVREFARLQSFPDSFTFTTDARRGPLTGRIDGGAAHSRYRQAGNAVPPLLAAAAATVLRETVLAARARRDATLRS